MISIPLALRPDTMLVKNPAPSGYGGEYLEAFEVQGVRLDSAAGLVNSGYVLSDGAKGVVYTGNSPLDVAVGALVAIRGVEYSVTKVTSFEAYRGRLHHYEIEVS